MPKQRPEVLFQCRMISKWAAWSAAILCGVILLLFVLALSSSDVDLITVFAAFSPAIAFVLVMGTAFFIEAATVFTITADKIVLTRLGRVITQMPRREISSAGVFVRYSNKGMYLYVSAEIPGGPVPANDHAKNNDPRFYTLKNTANKKGSRSICVEQTKERTEAMQRLIPEFDLKNVIRR